MYVPHNVYMMVSHSCWILLCIFCKCDQACVHVCVCVCVCKIAGKWGAIFHSTHSL